MQFGFKQKHCPFLINEVIQYYQNNNSPVYYTMLDASKAFDRVNYIRLFTLLRNKGLCPLYCRFLIMMYTNQQLFVKWNNTFSSSFCVSNGVKQGGVLSPILFNVYLDVLLLIYKNQGLDVTLTMSL